MVMVCCDHGNIADECTEICSNCGHDCGHHHYSTHVVCFTDDCMCKGFDYNDEYDSKEDIIDS